MEEINKVTIHISIEPNIVTVLYTSATNAEEICTNICKQLNLLPVSRPLFALRIQNSQGCKVWLPANSKLLHGNKYEFRMRFKVSSLNNLLSLDKNAYDYYFHQARKDVLENQIPEIVYAKHKSELLGLGVVDMYREMIEHKTPAEELEKNYKKYIPKEISKKHSIFTKKPIHISLGRLRKQTLDIWFVKNEYLKQVDSLAPNYLAEEYTAMTDLGCGSCLVNIMVAPYHAEQPGVRVCYDNKEWQHLCTIDDLCFISIRTDSTVEISRRNGIPSYLKFNTVHHMLSFVSILDGYYRLSVKWTFNLCKDVPTPSLKALNSMKCHGPVGGEFSYAKLEEKRNNKHGCFIIRECKQDFHTYFIDVCTKSEKPETYKVSIIGNEWIMHSNGSKYESLTHLISSCKNSEESPYLSECLPPSEYDKSPLLLCEPVVIAADSKACISDVEGLLRAPHCINPRDIQYFKSTKKDSEEGMICVYRAMWKVARGKKVEVAMKVLKSEAANEHIKEFTDLAGKWAFLESSSIVRLYGVTLGSPISMVMEYHSLGPLDQYLRENQDLIQVADLVEAGSQLATALWTLQENGFVHGNIRCHKILVSSHDANSLVVRLADPGLQSSYSTRDIHWIPPEWYSNLEFARKAAGADVWAFGTTLWEIFSNGKSPNKVNLNDTKRYYVNGKRLPQPEECPSDIYNLMRDCWDIDPHRRRKPQEIMRDLNQILYQVFNSRRTHSYTTVFPKTFKENSKFNGSACSLFSNATDETFLVRDCFSASDMERDSNMSLSSGFSGGSSQQGLDINASEDLCSNGSGFSISEMSAIWSNLNITQTTSLDSMHSMQCIFEVSADCNLVFQGRIGQGFYGEVYRGTLERVEKDKEPRLVAIKKLKTNALSSCMQDFEREINIMMSLKHPNIVEILCALDDPDISLVMEYVEHGSLQSYLKIYRDTTKIPTLLKFALDIAEGMKYLGQKKIVHRDLAARNILVASQNQVKISDFGLAQVTEKGEYYILKTNRDLPIKWYAPESLRDGKFSARSDVWSYGVTMFETFSKGEDPNLPALPGSPIDDAEPLKMLKALEHGIRLRQPDICPSIIYSKLMAPCWELQPSNRPTFLQLGLDVTELLKQGF